MSRSLSLSNLLLRRSLSPPLRRHLALRLTHSEPTDPVLAKLEDAIHRIIARRSAPDWLPFLPGSSYWVPPPKSNSPGLASLLVQLANPLSPEETLSTTSSRGWPSSEYFIKGAAPHPVPVDKFSNHRPLFEAPNPVKANNTAEDTTQSEDEEG